jgi:hypothetical protein
MVPGADAAEHLGTWPQALLKLQAANGNLLIVTFLSPVHVIVQFNACFLKTGLQY